MGLFSKNKIFDNIFKLDDDELLFKNCITFSYINIYDDNYIVQGFTISKDFCLISAYSKFKSNSRVYIYEKNGIFKNYVELDNNSHVGGITFDYLNNILYITGSLGRIYAYDYYELISGNISKYDCSINIRDFIDNASAATVYFYDNKLYVCTFDNIGKMVIYDLEVEKNKIVITNGEIIDNLPSAIQGVCVYKNKDEIYYLFSQSYGKIKSVIKLYDSNFRFISQKKLKCIGLEGIDIDYSGNVFGVFENGIDKIGKIHISTISSSLSNFSDKKFSLGASNFRNRVKKDIEK